MRNPDPIALLRRAIEIIEEEREVIQTSYAERDGVVRDYEARREIAKFDRWLKQARKAVLVSAAVKAVSQ